MRDNWNAGVKVQRCEMLEVTTTYGRSETVKATLMNSYKAERGTFIFSLTADVPENPHWRLTKE